MDTIQLTANKKFLILWVLSVVISRLIPHLPNMVPLVFLCMLLMSKVGFKMAAFVVTIALLTSNILLFLLSGSYNTMLGSWTIFTLTGYYFILYINSKSQSFTLKCTILLCAVYWVWTNFGSWLVMPEYKKNISGLVMCYSLALPFLLNQLFSNIALFSLFKLNRFAQRNLGKNKYYLALMQKSYSDSK